MDKEKITKGIKGVITVISQVLMGLFVTFVAGALLSFCFKWCEQYQEEKELKELEEYVATITLGEYLYLDVTNGIIHQRTSCDGLKKDSENIKDEVFKRLPTAEFIHAKGRKYCPRCVNDVVYNKIIQISNENIERKKQIEAQQTSVPTTGLGWVDDNF